VISRKREAHEVRLLERLITTGFAELTSYPLSEKRVAEVLDQLGIPQPSADLIALGRNLLNLELIGTIKQKQPDFDFFALMDEVDLWERYIQVLLEREEAAASPESAGMDASATFVTKSSKTSSTPGTPRNDTPCPQRCSASLTFTELEVYWSGWTESIHDKTPNYIDNS